MAEQLKVKTKITLSNLHKTIFADPKFMGKLSKKCKGSANRLKAALDDVEKAFAEETEKGKGKK